MSTERPGFQPARRGVIVIIKLVVSVTLLTILLYNVDLRSLWQGARSASITWLLVALALYTMSILACTLRWQLLLDAQNVRMPRRALFGSYLVASFFNNFLPSNIGGDVVRIRDTAQPAGSTTLATTIVLVDRLIGLLGLILVAALGATAAARLHNRAESPIWPLWLWIGFVCGALALAPALLAPVRLARLLRPLAVVHPNWFGERIETLTSALARFRDRPGTLAGCFTGSVIVQAILVAFYVAVVHALHMPITMWDLAVIVPISFVVQMLPVSVNGFGVREAAFSLYFTQLHQPRQSAILLSLMATAVIMVFSLSGAAVYVTRGR